MTTTRFRRPKHGVQADRFDRKPRDFASVASIDERIHVLSDRRVRLQRQLLADGSQWAVGRDGWLTELRRLEPEIVGLYAQKRAALAGMEASR